MTSAFELRDPDALARVRDLFPSVPFPDEVGLRLRELGGGWCESELRVRAGHQQSEGLVHAGVLATMVDHTAGAAATTLLASDEVVRTVEFKINLLRPATGPVLLCHAEVVRAGRALSFVEATVRGADAGPTVTTAALTIAVRHVAAVE